MAPRVRFFSCGAHHDRAKAAKRADVTHAHHRRGWRSPTVRPAPPHHPASCWRVWSPTSAEYRTARSPK
eukprot:5824503-Prymnesium_polylepis.1